MEMAQPGGQKTQVGSEMTQPGGRMSHLGSEVPHYGTGMAQSRLDGSLFTKPRDSLPLTTQAFTRGASGANAVDLFTPPAPSAKMPSSAVSREKLQSIILACLHDQNESGFFRGPAFIQPIRTMLKSFQML